jgi:hypothetical protein
MMETRPDHTDLSSVPHGLAVERLEDVSVESAPKEDIPMAPNPDRPTFTVALESGTWLVDVHPAHAQRVWRFTGEGFDGHGSRIKRAEVARTVNELIAKAEELEGIEPSYHRPKEERR